MKDDGLRLYDENREEDVTVSVIEVKTEEKKKVKKYNFFSVMLSAVGVKNHSEVKGEDVPVKKPLPTNTVKAFYITVICALVLLCSYFIADLGVLIPIVLAFSALIVPMLSVGLFFELNTRKNVSVISVFCSFTTGALLCLLLSKLRGNFTQDVYAYSLSIDYYTALENVLKFILAVVLIKLYKARQGFSAMLIAVAIFSGFSFVRSAGTLFGELFVQTTSEDAYGISTVSSIINTPSVIDDSLKNLIKSIPYYALYMPILDLCCAIVVGRSLSVAETAIYEGKEYAHSIYLTTIFVIILCVLGARQSIFTTVELILHIVVLIALCFTAIMNINAVLSTENYE